MINRRVLFVARLSPPSICSAARRVGGMVRYLAQLDHHMTVLTSSVSGIGPIEGAAQKIMTRDLMESRLNWRRKNLGAIHNEGDSNYDAQPSVLSSMIVPDLDLVTWVPAALFRAFHLRHKIDCVITSGPPHSSHLIGLFLRKRGVPWIADFRDGWTFESGRPNYPTSLQRKVDEYLERLTATTADVIVGVTSPITQDIEERFNSKAVTITNGFDPDEIVEPSDGWSPPLTKARHSLVYTGGLSYADRSVKPFFEALEILAHEEPAFEASFEAIFAGPTTSAERASFLAQGDYVRHLGNLGRGSTLALQRAADSLLVIAGERHKSVATGKLYEYMAANRPILVLGQNSAAAKIIQETQTGIVAPANEATEIASAIKKLIEIAQQPRSSLSNDVVARFGYPNLSAAMAQQIETAIAKATG